jgi:hypothetical protein
MSAGCSYWRELLAADAFGDLDADERLGVRSHREGCPACDAIGRDFSTTVTALSWASPSALDAVAPVPVDLSDRVLGALSRNSRSATSRRVAIVASLAAAIVVVVVAVGVALTGTSAPPPPSVTDALSAPSGVNASVVLTSESWGTSVRFTESGQSGTSEYTVQMGTSNGSWWNAGTYHAVDGRRVVTTMSCAVTSSEISYIRVTSPSGDVVMQF